MSECYGKQLHIVSFNIPYPPDYGGVIDVYYKIKALHDIGIKVHLHAFHYGREKSPELESLCETVSYYERKKFYQAIYKSVPYVVGSRQSGELLANLSADEHPILFEGLHTCFYLSHKAIRHKIKAVRMHNVEWDYYKSLGEQERNYLLKFYFLYESQKLKKFEEELKYADHVLTISPNDYEYFSKHGKKIHYIPAFHSNEKITSKTGKGDYVLYHGNLSVVENNQAALYILKKIAPRSKHEFIIAGKNPLESLRKEIKNQPNVTLVYNPSFETMSSLISNAHICLLPTFQNTGIKLKLINSLYKGRFCIVNKPMIENTGLEPLCFIEENADSCIRIIDELFEKDFTEEDIKLRQEILYRDFSNINNAKKICSILEQPAAT
ncbi:MAG: glycosyltransferase [Chitinophagales bacterium]|nr:glycosyltransferase [Chitinophagales bacterium]MDW8273901.1 glycosyltransferase [Chitinophagales bacterium]